ncbi:MAG: zinc-dependent metalloprotease, partial [Gemmatimonadaceae bacterium]
NSLSKAIGGMEYANAVAGDAQQATRPVPAAEQREALRQLLRALAPAELAIPDSVVTLMAPGASSVTPTVELFGARTRPAFDELGAARTLAQMIVDMVLQRERAARLVQQGIRPGQLTLGEVIDALLRQAFAPAPAGPAKAAALQRVTQRAVVDRLIGLAADDEAAPEVRAMADYKLRALAARLNGARGSEVAVAHAQSLRGDITRWLERSELPKPTPALVAPPGDPFGEP